MQSLELENKVKNLEVVGLLDNRIQELSFNALQEASEHNWYNVVECFRELAHICKRRCLHLSEFLAIRKELILAMESYEPLAKTHIELEEKNHVKKH